MKKAFDSVDWKFIFKVLRAFGFGLDECQWISTFYKYIKSSVTVNGQLAQWFAIQRGCRQGDPISPYLFGGGGGGYIVKTYNSFQTLGNKFQQGLFQLQHKKRIRLTRKHVSGIQSVRKLTMIQIIIIITQTIFLKGVTGLQESTNDRVTEH